MKIYELQFKTSILIAVFFAFLFFIFYFQFLTDVRAQTSSPQFLVSWQASSYAPNWFQGKVFPTMGSLVAVKFDLIDNGKIIDLSKLKVRWYLNDNLKRNETNGLGIRSYTFIDNDYPGSDTNVRISIPEYNGGLDYAFDIPVANPEITLNAPYADKIIKAGNLNFEAIPFFFNVTDLSSIIFKWVANGQSTDELNRAFLNLNASSALSGLIIDLSVSAKNLLNDLESVSKNMSFTVQ